MAQVLERLGVVYERRGARLLARCPAHAPDRSPSWSVAWRGDGAGLHYCFACGFGGGLVDLVARVRGFAGVRTPMDTDLDVEEMARDEARAWLDAVEEAAPEPVPGGVRVEARAARAFALPGGVEFGPVEGWVTPAARYVLERRRISPGQVARWGLGYAVHGRLAGRVVIPVRDRAGRLRTYMARAFGDAPKRYLYPRREEGADPAALFGEEHWPALSGGRRSCVVVCEGAFNALAVDRALRGRVAVAALGGAEVHAEHLAKLASFARVVVLTDADAAGERAARDLGAGLTRHCYVYRADPPAGGDIDEVEPAEVVRVIEGEVFG